MRTRRTVVVLISGKAFAGKTTTKLMLMDKFSTIKGLRLNTYSFASAVKEVATFMGWNGEKDEAGRRLLQGIGKVGRDYNISTWVSRFFTAMDNSKEIFPPNFIFIDDWRFVDEFEFINKNPLIDVFTVRVEGRGGIKELELSSDESETGLDSFSGFDFTLDNSGTLQELEIKCDMLVDTLSKKYLVE